MVLPPTPRARSEPMPVLPGFMVGMWRLGKLKGRAWVLKSVRVLMVGPPSTMATFTPRWARWAAKVPPPAPEPTIQISKTCFGICSRLRIKVPAYPLVAREGQGSVGLSPLVYQDDHIL